MTITANTGTYLPIQDGRFFGIDISSYQDPIDFAKMSQAHKYGFPPIRFIACRTGISWGYKDKFFGLYWQAAKDFLPVPRFAYHVLYPDQDISRQMDNVIGCFPGGKFDGDAFVNDLELHRDCSPAKISAAAMAFTERLKEWCKKPVFIYSRHYFVKDYMDYKSTVYANWLKEQKWWMAWYTGTNPPTEMKPGAFPFAYIEPRLPAYIEALPVLIHQTGEKGDGRKIGTTSAQVDTNRWLGTEAEFKQLWGVQEDTEYPTPQPQPVPIDISAELAAIREAATRIEEKVK